MKFDLDAIYIEDDCRDTALARRVMARAASTTPIHFIADGRIAARPALDVGRFVRARASAAWLSCGGAVLS